jgi:hypothetical protein
MNQSDATAAPIPSNWSQHMTGIATSGGISLLGSQPPYLGEVLLSEIRAIVREEVRAALAAERESRNVTPATPAH